MLAGARTTCLPKYMERGAYLADRLEAGPLLPHLSRLRRGRGARRARRPGGFERGPRATKRGTDSDDTAAFVVEDGHYVSARWPGDAYLFAKRFDRMLSA